MLTVKYRELTTVCFKSQVLERRLITHFFWGQSSQKCLIVTVLCIHEVKIPIGLKCHKRPIGLRWSNIRKLDSLWNVSCQPGQHLHLKAVRTWLPPELVNIRANKPMEGSGGSSTQEYHRRCYCTFQDDIHIGGCHEGYDRTKRYRKATSWERQKFYFLYGVWDRAIINDSSFLVTLPWLSSTTRSDANLVVFLCSWDLWCPSSLENSKMGGSFEWWIGANGSLTGRGPKTTICWRSVFGHVAEALWPQQVKESRSCHCCCASELHWDRKSVV